MQCMQIYSYNGALGVDPNNTHLRKQRRRRDRAQSSECGPAGPLARDPPFSVDRD